MRKSQLIVGSLVLLVTCAGLGAQGAAGLPSAEKNPGWRELLPRPVYDAEPGFIDLYRATWEIVHSNIDVIAGLPCPRYFDENLAGHRIFVWDTPFHVQICKYCPEEFPGAESLENLYRILLDRFSPLPKTRATGFWRECNGSLRTLLIQHADNPPILAWGEYALALQTGDRARLRRVFVENRWLQRWFEMFENYNPNVGKPMHGVLCKGYARKTARGFLWSRESSGMDNTPRGRRKPRDPKDPVSNCKATSSDLLWVDALSQQGLSALCMSRIARILALDEEAEKWRKTHEAIQRQINEFYWDETDGMYYDIYEKRPGFCKVMTPAAYWTMLAELVPSDRRDRMVAHLVNPLTLGGEVPTPTVARNDPDFYADGGYFRGSIWLPTTYVAIKGANWAGAFDVARLTARKVLWQQYRTYREYAPHSIWECYSPTEPKPGARKVKGTYSYPDYSWGAVGPISLFLEDVIGIKEANAFDRTLWCEFERNPKGRVGVENYRFGDVVCSVVATAERIAVESNRAFTLKVDGRRVQIRPGKTVLPRGGARSSGESGAGPKGGV